MLIVETVAKIRRAYFVQKKPIKVICRELRVSRKVVRKVLRSGETAFEYERSVQPLPKIGPFKAGGPYTVSIAGSKTATLNNVLFGDVWICSGQSNMEFGITGAINAKADVDAANFPNIRLYMVPRKTSLNPEAIAPGEWKYLGDDYDSVLSIDLGTKYGLELRDSLTKEKRAPATCK